MVVDTIGDMITRIKNAQKAGHFSVTIPHSNFKNDISDLLAKEGFIKSASKKGRKIKKVIEIELIYKDSTPKITEIKRISRPSKRIYKSAGELRRGTGRGLIIVSTPKGVLSATDAAKENIGGEVLFSIW
jgi:small subunit ribosomal protein S8